MIRNPDFPTGADILKLLSSSEHLPDRVGGGASTQERMEAQASAAEIAATKPQNIKAVCVGCGGETPILEAVGCRCGGFVCRHCQESEEEGVCDHEPYMVGDNDDDDDPGHQ